MGARRRARRRKTEGNAGITEQRGTALAVPRCSVEMRQIFFRLAIFVCPRYNESMGREITVKEFKRCMQCGLGRCAIALQSTENKEKYRKVLLWGCTHPLTRFIALDGTRSCYLYELLQQFGDKEYFLQPILTAFESCTSARYPLFAQLCDLLALFAEDGYGEAAAALENSYAALLGKAFEKGAMSGVYQCLDYLCVDFFELKGESAVWRSAEELARLFSTKPRAKAHLGWYMFRIADCRGGKLLSALEKAGKRNAMLGAFAKAVKDSGRVSRSRGEEEESSRAEKALTRLQRACTQGENYREKDLLQIQLRANRSQGEVFARLIRAEQSEQRKARLIGSLTEKNNALSACELYAYTSSTDRSLKDAAYAAIASLKIEGRRAFAQQRIATGQDLPYAAALLAGEYENEDKDAFLRALHAVDNHTAHWVFSKILDAVIQGKTPLPRETLPYIYENTPCEICREYAVRALSRRRMADAAMIEEWRFDSSSEIRDLAESKLRRQKF